MRFKLFTFATIALCVFMLGADYGKKSYIKHMNKIKTPAITASSSVVDAVVDKGFDLVMELAK